MSSTFEVTVRTIDKIWPHPSADRLELASVGGLAFQLCCQKGIYTVGQKVVYFPVDSQLPQWIIDKLGLWGKDEQGNVIRDAAGRVVKTMLVGNDQNRLHTVQLRGEISQGMICPIDEILADYLTVDIETLTTSGRPGVQPVTPKVFTDGEDVTVLLGVTKYDAPESILPGAKLLPFPDGVTPFDVESADSNPDVLALLMDVKVWITEKLEGTNHALVRMPEDGRHAVCSRNNEVQELTEPDESGNPPAKYPGWEAVRSRYAEPWQVILEQVPRPEFPSVPVAIRGELIGPGVPKSFYPGHEPVLRAFAIKVGPNYLDAADVCMTIPPHMRVPTLAWDVTLREWLAGRTIQEASNGKSLLAPDRLREGIVVVPMVEQKVQWKNGSIKRLMLKQRSPKYLANEKD
jgi:hypothetical protein